MPKIDPRIDAYIGKAQPFAQPILKHMRKIVNNTCPNVEETTKWSFPHFNYNGIMLSIASFKAHCTITFWKGAIMKDPHKAMSKVGETAMGQFGRILSIDDLPGDDILIEYIREAMKLNETGEKVPAKPKKEKTELVIPDYFIAAVKKNKKALETFENFSYSHKKEYVEWVVGAKREETREKRIKQAIETMSEGKPKEWRCMPEFRN